MKSFEIKCVDVSEWKRYQELWPPCNLKTNSHKCYTLFVENVEVGFCSVKRMRFGYEYRVSIIVIKPEQRGNGYGNFFTKKILSSLKKNFGFKTTTSIFESEVNMRITENDPEWIFIRKTKEGNLDGKVFEYIGFSDSDFIDLRIKKIEDNRKQEQK